MALAERKVKDQEQAARMKASGEERESGRCPCCYQMVQCGRPQADGGHYMTAHMMQCATKARPGSTKAHRYQDGLRVSARR